MRDSSSHCACVWQTRRVPILDPDTGSIVLHMIVPGSFAGAVEATGTTETTGAVVVCTTGAVFGAAGAAVVCASAKTVEPQTVVAARNANAEYLKITSNARWW